VGTKPLTAAIAVVADNQAIGRRYLAVTYSPLRPDSGPVEAVLAIGRDLTEHVLASEALREAQIVNRPGVPTPIGELNY
jgi:hypothetical protein